MNKKIVYLSIVIIALFLILVYAYFHTFFFKKEIGNDFFKDSLFVYVKNCESSADFGCMLSPSVEIVPGIDSKTLECLDRSYYCKDKNTVFYFTYKNFAKVDGANPKKFKAIFTEDGWATSFGVDDKSVFYYDRIIYGVDPGSIEFVCKDYFKDKDHVFYNDNSQGVVVGVDPKSFECFHTGDNYFGIDDTHVIVRGKIVKDAKPGIFGVTENGKGYEDYKSIYDMDGNFVRSNY
jgi:hypothetical protein